MAHNIYYTPVYYFDTSAFDFFDLFTKNIVFKYNTCRCIIFTAIILVLCFLCWVMYQKYMFLEISINRAYENKDFRFGEEQAQFDDIVTGIKHTLSRDINLTCNLGFAVVSYDDVTRKFLATEDECSSILRYWNKHISTASS